MSESIFKWLLKRVCTSDSSDLKIKMTNLQIEHLEFADRSATTEFVNYL